jgi:hypothetical protein
VIRAISAAARSIGSRVVALSDPTPVTLRTYCSAAAYTSSEVAAGSSPRRTVMFLHMLKTVRPEGDRN